MRRPSEPYPALPSSPFKLALKPNPRSSQLQLHPWAQDFLSQRRVLLSPKALEPGTSGHYLANTMQWNEWDSGQNAGMCFTETSACNEAPKYILKHQNGWQFCRSVKQLWQWRHQGEPQYIWQPLCSPPAELPPWSRPLFCTLRFPQVELKGLATARQLHSSQSHTMDDIGLLRKKCVVWRRGEKREEV